MDELLSAETKNFQSIMTESKKLKIPRYQRDYSWDEAQWDELFNDILKGKKNKSKHYMGALVFINRKDNTLEVVDGQQRLTTITIMIHSVIKFINELIKNDVKKDENIERINIIKSYIGKKSSKDLTWENRLELNEENNKFYNTYIMNFEQVTSVPEKVSSSNKLLINCQQFFYKKILEYSNITDIKKITDKKLFKIMELIDYVVENLIFVKIVATNELSAYTIFETLNNRGIDLISDLHILKVKQCYPLLMVTLKKINRKYWRNVFKACEVISFRYLTICGKNPNVLEDVYNKICNKIMYDEINNYNDIKIELKKIYIKDDEFCENFDKKTINTKGNQRTAKYILIKMNTYISTEKIDLDINKNNLTLEHILPESPNEYWKTVFPEDNIEDYIYRIGNFALLSQKRNQNVANSDYNTKKELYKKSEIAITRNIENIEKRQKHMSDKAKEIWKI